MSKIDYVFLDGGHEYNTVKNDLDNCIEVIKKGGTVLCDDYNLGSDGVLITVKATSNITGCAWQQTEAKSIGIIPDPEFRWKNITEGNNTLFEFRERKLELYDFAWQELQEFNFTIEKEDGTESVSYTHLTLPTNREV